VFAEAVTSDGWYKMGDYGYYDQEERVHVLERVKDLIRLPSGKLVISEPSGVGVLGSLLKNKTIYYIFNEL
jgi:hypothetical protein